MTVSVDFDINVGPSDVITPSVFGVLPKYVAIPSGISEFRADDAQSYTRPMCFRECTHEPEAARSESPLRQRFAEASFSAEAMALKDDGSFTLSLHESTVPARTPASLSC